MRYLSVCSGIESASVAWHALGFTPVAFAEIEDFPSAVLAQRFPHVPNVGDFTAIDTASLPDVDLLVGGTPCQSFSIAGKRLSLKDARGNLTLAFTVLAHELQDKHGLLTVCWENVPGILTASEDNAFGCFISALVGGRDPVPLPRGFERWPDHGMVAGPRGRLVWRVLDAQWFGLAQRRERVFVICDLGSGIDPAAVLFEPKGVSWDYPPVVEARTRAATRAARAARPKSIWQAFGVAFRKGAGAWAAQRTAARGDVAPTMPARTRGGAASGLTSSAMKGSSPFPLNDLDGVSHALTASGYMDASVETYIAHTLTGEGFDASEDGTGRGTPIVPAVPPDIASTLKASDGGISGKDAPHIVACGFTRPGDPCPTLVSEMHAAPAVAFSMRTRDGDPQAELDGKVSSALRSAEGGSTRPFLAATDVRRLTVVECERLQGFPDNWTLIHGDWRPRKPINREETISYLKAHGFGDNEAVALADCPDGPRYRAIGNSMATKCMKWIGTRLKMEGQRQ
jgi:DNA (cytosine-5)-methyltransferase 1